MDRRNFVKAGTIGAAVTAIAAPAIAQSSPELRWRLTSVVPKTLLAHWGSLELFAKIVSEATDGRFQIQLFSVGEIVDANGSFDAVKNNTVEVAHTALHYFIGRSRAFPVMSSLPFGMNTRQSNAWFYRGGGIDLCNSVLAKHGVYALPAGSTGEQMGGWFRKEIKTVADLKGLRFRIPGLAGEILSKLGVLPVMIPAADVYPSLERGTIDGADFIQPSDDEKFGFQKVAPYYYYPSPWEGASYIHLVFNSERWNALPKAYKAVVTAAAKAANHDQTEYYDTVCGPALRRLVAAGTKLTGYNPDLIKTIHASALELYKDFAAKDPDFKLVYDAHMASQRDQSLWNQIAEFNYNKMIYSLL